MNWPDPEALKKWRPLAMLLLVASIIGALNALFGVSSSLVAWWIGDRSFTGHLVAEGGYIAENEVFVDLLNANVGKKISLDMTLGYGEYAYHDVCQDQTREWLEVAKEEHGDDFPSPAPIAGSLDFIVLSSATSCVMNIISIGEEDTVLVSRNPFGQEYAVIGDFIVTKPDSPGRDHFGLVSD